MKRIRLRHERLAKELARRGESQKDIARRLGISAPHLSMLIRGKRPYPSGGTRRKLLQGLGLEFEDLFAREPGEETADKPSRDFGRSGPASLRFGRPGPPSRGLGRPGAALARGTGRDLRFAWRILLKRPLLSALMILTLALGIGANTAIFSVVNGVLLRPLPFRDPDRLVLVWSRLPANNIERDSSSLPNFRDLRDHNDFFDSLGALAYPVGVNLSGDGNPVQVKMVSVSAGFFSVLGGGPAMGREFNEKDVEKLTSARRNSQPVTSPLILSYGLWQSRFAGDPRILGRKVLVNGGPMEVVGVLPADFRFFQLMKTADLGISDDIDAFSPLVTNIPAWPRELRTIRIVGRLKPNVALAEARQKAQALSARLREDHLELQKSGFEFDIAPLRKDFLEQVRPALLALLGAVGFVLLIACANVANLLMARAAARRREITIRAALGAGRTAIIRQVLAESLLLGLAGAAGGLLLAYFGLQWLIALEPSSLPRLEDIRLDATVLAFAMAASLAAALLFGLLPALQLSRPNLAQVLAQSGKGGSGLARQKSRQALVAAQVSLSLVLLVGAGLMLRTFDRLHNAELGFQPEGVLTANISLPFSSYGTPRKQADFFYRLERELEREPEVQAAGANLHLPMSAAWWEGPFWLPGDEIDRPRHRADYRIITPGYFRAVGAELLDGRTFTEEEYREGRRVAVVDAAFARRAWPGWPGDSPIGGSVRVFPEQVPPYPAPIEVRVVGVVEHIRNVFPSLDDRPAIYFPPELCPFTSFMDVAVRGRAGADLRPAVRRAVDRLDPGIALADVRALSTYVDEALAPTRFTLSLIGIFAAAALFLALIGLYGVQSYSVARRTRELGLRMALGAGRTRILRHVLSSALRLTLIGSAAGLAGAALLSRALTSSLHGVGPFDPLTYLAVTALLVAVALLASYLPAHRATRVDPLSALRAE